MVGHSMSELAISGRECLDERSRPRVRMHWQPNTRYGSVMPPPRVRVGAKPISHRWHVNAGYEADGVERLLRLECSPCRMKLRCGFARGVELVGGTSSLSVCPGERDSRPRNRLRAASHASSHRGRLAHESGRQGWSPREAGRFTQRRRLRGTRREQLVRFW